MKIYLIKKDNVDFHNTIKNIGVDPYCIDLLNNKTKLPIFYLKDIKIEQANILKQTALTVGCDVAIHRNVISGTKKISDAVMICTYSQLMKIKNKLNNQPFSLEKILNTMLDIFNYKDEWLINGNNILEKKDFVIMGILNITPDSFYDGGKYNDIKSILNHCESMILDGADIIDIGGESTRPFSEEVPLEKERNRVIPIIKEIRKHFPDILISIDTYKSSIAEESLDNGANIINDISGFNFDKKILKIIKKYNASSIAMHIKGTPKDMQKNPKYENLLFEITDYLQESVENAIEHDIDINTIAIDPGIGFGKTVDDNYTIINSLYILKSLKRPILMGTSNKSFIGKYLDLPVNERIEGTIASNVISFINGAKIFRVHNVKENVRALKIISKTVSMYDKF